MALPGAIESVTATDLGGGRVRVDYSSSDGATSYRVAAQGQLITRTASQARTATFSNVSTGRGNFCVTGVNDEGIGPVRCHAIIVSSLPGAISSVTATDLGGGRVRVSWTSSSGATSYQVDYGIGIGVGGVSATLDAQSRSYTFSNVTAGSREFCVRGVNQAGNGPDRCHRINVREATPGAITSVTATDLGDGRVRVDYTESAGATSYRIDYGIGIGFGGVATVRSASLARSYTFENVTEGSREFCVRGINSAGNGPYRCHRINVAASSSLPGPILSVVASDLGGGKVRVNWTTSSHATSYRVTGETGAGFPNNLETKNASVDTREVTFSSISAGEREFCVQGINDEGEGDRNCETITAGSIPGPIVSVTATDLGDGRVQFAYSSSAGAVEYTLGARIVGESSNFATVIRAASAARVYIFEGLEADRWQFCASGKNSHGNGAINCHTITVVGGGGTFPNPTPIPPKVVVDFPQDANVVSQQINLDRPGVVAHKSPYTGHEILLDRGSGRFSGQLIIGETNDPSHAESIESWLLSLISQSGVGDIPLNRETVDDLESSVQTNTYERGELNITLSSEIGNLDAGKYIRVGNRLLIITKLLSKSKFTYNPQIPIPANTRVSQVTSIRIRLQNAEQIDNLIRNPDWYGPWTVNWVEALQ